uniref:Family with sequence similarity 151 member B n=1 Tax=Takifugu rubripes TaxID=31033 RepID=A0A674PLJ3_TAKRU
DERNSHKTHMFICSCNNTTLIIAILLARAAASTMTLQYFLSRGLIRSSDAAEVSWCHGVNSRSGLMEALSGSAHMMEADVLMRECDPKEPIMAHPPARDSDITLKEWLQEVKEQQKGIKLDFKSLEAVAPSLVLLEEVLAKTNLPVWINADVLAGPGGHAQPLDPQAFLSAVRDLPPHVVLSLGWTTGWTAGMDNPGYSWDMVRVMEGVCRALQHPVTFPVRAVLLARSAPQLRWLLQQSHRYTLTVWTGQTDTLTPQDLLPYRRGFDRSRVYYDLPPSLRTELNRGTQDGDV